MMLSLRGITKRFAGTTALDKVDFDLAAGEVHALFGENGAGKSTLINIIIGSYPPDEGSYHYLDRAIEAATPHRTRALGIAAVFQEFSLVPSLTVAENLFLGHELRRHGLLDKPAMRARARAVLDNLGFSVSERALVAGLSRAEQQMVEIAKALLGEPRVLVLDEPTASLTDAEAEHLFGAVRELRARGVGIVYVTHRMPEIRRLADRVTVLRGGVKVGTLDAAGATDSLLVEMMVGQPVSSFFPTIRHRPADTILETRELRTASGSVKGVSIAVRAGEVVGLAGLVGCGKGEVGRAVFGIAPLAGGRVVLRGGEVAAPAPRAMLQSRVCYFPSDRAAEGLTLNRTVRENCSMAALDLAALGRLGWLRLGAEAVKSRSVVERLRVRPPDIERRVAALSGGNRQKVMLTRGLMRDIDLFIFDEPSVGIDVGAKAEIYGLLKDLVEAGAAVLLISSDLAEVLHLSHRAYVMHEGRLVAELAGERLSEANLLSCFFGTALPSVPA
jgi:ribose transport system ATP-binding protein